MKRASAWTCLAVLLTLTFGAVPSSAANRDWQQLPGIGNGFVDELNGDPDGSGSGRNVPTDPGDALATEFNGIVRLKAFITALVRELKMVAIRHCLQPTEGSHE